MKPRSSSSRRARLLLGTLVEIEAHAATEAECLRAIDAAFAEVENVQRRMSFHDPASTVSRLNREAAQHPVRVDEDTFAVLTCAAEVQRVSQGLFDVAIAPALQALGFLPAAEPAHPAAAFGPVVLNTDRTVEFRVPGTRIDLGGIAKGFAVDRAIEVLESAGVAAALVNAGGDLRACGSTSFAVAIRDPRAPGRALATVPLRARALATSAHYFADRLVAGAEFGPILHPRTHRPAEAQRSATVLAPTAMLADALTKVVMLAGHAALPTLEHFGAEALFVAATGEAMCSSGFHATLELSA